MANEEVRPWASAPSGRQRFYAVIRRSDGHVIALCEEVRHAIAVVLKASREHDCAIWEAEAEVHGLLSKWTDRA